MQKKMEENHFDELMNRADKNRKSSMVQNRASIGRSLINKLQAEGRKSSINPFSARTEGESEQEDDGKKFYLR